MNPTSPPNFRQARRRLADQAPAHLAGSGNLERVYELPRDTRSSDDWHRRRHQDLPGLSDFDLTRDARRVAQRLDYESDPFAQAWLRERLDRVAAERRSRDRQERAERSRPVASTTARPGLTVRRNGQDRAL